MTASWASGGSTRKMIVRPAENRAIDLGGWRWNGERAAAQRSQPIVVLAAAAHNLAATTVDNTDLSRVERLRAERRHLKVVELVEHRSRGIFDMIEGHAVENRLALENLLLLDLDDQFWILRSDIGSHPCQRQAGQQDRWCGDVAFDGSYCFSTSRDRPEPGRRSSAGVAVADRGAGARAGALGAGWIAPAPARDWPGCCSLRGSGCGCCCCREFWSCFSSFRSPACWLSGCWFSCASGSAISRSSSPACC